MPKRMMDWTLAELARYCLETDCDECAFLEMCGDAPVTWTVSEGWEEEAEC